MDTIFQSICTSTIPEIKGIKPNNIQIVSDNVLLVRPFVSARGTCYYVLQQMKEKLPQVVIKVNNVFNITV